jgi:hypothetical protein
VNAVCEGGTAYRIKEIYCERYALEFLVYRKWGADNLNVRLRLLTDAEKEDALARQEKANAAPQLATNAQVDDLARAWQPQFGRGRKKR